MMTIVRRVRQIAADNGKEVTLTEAEDCTRIIIQLMERLKLLQ